jgi:hypothetical protein
MPILGLFRLYAKHSKRKNFIPRIMDNDAVLADHNEKAQATCYVYHNLIGMAEDRDFSIGLDRLNFPQMI